MVELVFCALAFRVQNAALCGRGARPQHPALQSSWSP